LNEKDLKQEIHAKDKDKDEDLNSVRDDIKIK
jgi:hypothetical protein